MGHVEASSDFKKGETLDGCDLEQLMGGFQVIEIRSIEEKKV